MRGVSGDTGVGTSAGESIVDILGVCIENELSEVKYRGVSGKKSTYLMRTNFGVQKIWRFWQFWSEIAKLSPRQKFFFSPSPN